MLGSGNALGYHTCTDCPPTASPAPTESPAPSPSPSEVPTDTQKPSVSLYPSTSPTPAPTTSEPSSMPSDFPTESPAPSPSPSEAPTMRPSGSPSISFKPSLSLQPSLSSSPSVAPSEFPSQIPSDSPSSRPSISPSYHPSHSPTISPQPSISESESDAVNFMISSNNEVAFEGFNALLSREAKEDFEEILLAYLSNHGTSVEQRTLTFESVRVTDQFIKESPSNKRTNTSTLHVVFDVAAFVTPQEDYSPFNYNRFVRSFFDNEATLDAFSTQLKNTSDHFGGDLKLVLTITGSEIIEAPEESEPSTPNKTSTLVASVAGATVFFGGLATILWLRRRGKESILAIEPSPSSCEDIEEQYALSVKPTETYDTGSYGDDTPSEMSSPTAGYPTPHMYYGTSTLTKRDLVPHEGIQSARSIDTEEHTLGTASMFRPTFLSAESNIEIPITPMTNHDLSLITPRDVEVEAFETWVPSPSQSDAADECLIHETTPGRSQWDPVRIFGFGMRSKQKKEKEMKEVEAKSMAEEVQFNEQCAAVRPCSSNFNQSRLSSANNISTFSPLFSDPSNMLKTAWHESRSAEIPPFDLDVWETKELPMSSSSQGSAPSVSSETHLTDTKTGRNTEDGKNSRANISMKLMNEDFQLNEVFDFHEQTASTHRDGKYHALYEDLSTASPSPAETAAASPSSSKTPTEESYFAAWTQNLSPTRTTLASESPSVDPVITWIPIARRVEAPQKTIVMSQPPSTLAFQSFTPTTTIPVSSPTKSPAKNPSVASNSANSSSMPPMSVYPSDLAPQNGSEGLYQSSLPSEELVMRPSRSPTSTMTRTSHPSAVVPTNPEESSIHPSDYPSEKPSDYVPLGSIHPTSMPLGNESTNRLPSNQATISNESSRPSSSNDRPSKTPSPSIFFPISPSNQPSALEHVRVDPTSIEPSTGQRQLIGNVNATISSVTGTMGDSAVALFEKTVLSFLTDRFPQLVGFDIDFQNVDVQRQVFHHDNRRLQDGNRTGDLAVFFMVVAFFYPEMPKGFDFQWSMESFFAANSDQLSSQLETLDLVFHTDRIEGSGIEENSMDIEENQNSLADFFTRTVIVGTSFTIAAVLLIGAFVMSRMWRSQEGHRMESPGRLGALPSYDSEDRILGRRSSSDELNPSDPQSVFLSFSQLSRLDQKPSVNRTFTSELGPKSVGSVNNSSTNGSHLVGLNLLSSSSAESKNGTRSNLLSFHAGKTTKQLIGFNGHTLYIDERDAIRRRTKNILDDLESQSKGSSKDFVEVQWDEQSTKSLSINIEKTSSEESLARKRKRKLEKKLQESKRKAACQAMQTLLENEEWKEGSRRACLSMKEFIVHSSSFDDEFQKRGWQEHPSRSYSSQFLSINPSESNQYSPAQPSPKMSEFELFEMAQRVPVAGTPENTAKKVYNRMSDISGTIVEEPNVEAAYSEETENAQEEVVNANSMTRKKQRRSSGWFRKVMTPEKPQFKDNSERAPNSRGRTFGLFGRNNRPRAWDQNSDSCPLSPSKRYRRGGRGQLVPRRLARGQPDDENSLASHIDSTDDENYEHFGNILIGGARGSPRGEGLCSPDVLGIAAEKQRPPMLDLKDLEEADHSENDEDVECPLVTHPPPSSQELHMTYGRDLLYGQDPDGFELTTHNRRNRTINTGSRVPGLMSQSSSQSDDPPTASEHRRIISARRKARRSALRKKDSPRRVEAERVTFYKKTIEFPVNEDSIILGSIDTNDSELELEWGNMI